MVKVKFWGVRGSVPAPLTGEQVEHKIKEVSERLNSGTALEKLPFWMRSTYGGNTPCVEIVHRGSRIVLDMGTGMRSLGNSLFKEMLERRGLDITFLLSHVHWDHIQGLPFFGPLYINKETGIKNSWNFYGGTDWMKTAEICLRGQMDPPTFPISWNEIEKITHLMKFYNLHDRKRFIAGRDAAVEVYTRKLNHPQETFGWRLTFCEPGKEVVLVYTTDNEPNDPRCPDPKLIDLIRNADLWITDCQFTKSVYEGAIGGVPRHNWGHSYPEAVAEAAFKGGVSHVALFHHDPNSTDEDIFQMQLATEKLVKDVNNIQIISAHEGLEIAL